MKTTQNTIEQKQIGNYVFTIIKRENTTRYPAHPFAVIYEKLTPKAKYSPSKIISNFVFKTIEEAQNWVSEKYGNLAANIESNNKRKEEQRAANSAVNAADFFSVGDIVVNTWGWEQTNVDFFQVVKVGNKTIEVAEISGETVEGSMMSHGMACDLVPAKNSFRENGKKYTLRVKAEGRLSNPESYYYMKKWDGRSQYCSWYA